MSSEIEYRYAQFAFDGQRAFKRFEELSEQQGEKQFFPSYGRAPCVVTFCEHGGSRDYENGSNRRARNWSLERVGEVGPVMDSYIRSAIYVEHGTTWIEKHRTWKAEDYIRASRKRIGSALPLEQLQRYAPDTVQIRCQGWDAERVAKHPWWRKAKEEGRLRLDRYGDHPPSVLVVRFRDIEDLECDLLAIAAATKGEHASYGSFPCDYREMTRAIERASGNDQAALFAA